MKKLLIVFVKNPVKGAVKTRLASTIGAEQALNVYVKLMAHTLQILSAAKCDKVVYYSDFIPSQDEWQTNTFAQKIQEGADLGERMMNAFHDSFSKGYELVCIIGSDCYELTTEHLESAFSYLTTNEAVLGPTHDGGYYLLGMRRMQDEVFKNKKWSTESVLSDTMNDLAKYKISYALMPTLSDIDNWEDLKNSALKI